ncbi:SigE family RNA polymerase sigma factor [Nocardioides zhouii]|uniref:SigE family RNA polymerase sigma factor n=1 Tax=Nocardioides zhouii TaxID=1168729 RepID=A0A4Q2SFF7_9ACTN|nr:SigE family RNA polymerase sigma factor [Nocardioides zhouii]RYC04155.1 SigE family RNA polymerase sigma factor [Nocardioides zhouii]
MDADTAFADFVRARSTALLRTAYLLTGDRAQAEDLVQEALLSVYRSRGRIREPAAIEGYVRTTLVRTHISTRRRRSTTELSLERIPEQPREAEEPIWAGETWPAVLALPARQRAVIVLAYFHDLSEVEIAGVLGCSTGAVKSHRARALAALRGVLAPTPSWPGSGGRR